MKIPVRLLAFLLSLLAVSFCSQAQQQQRVVHSKATVLLDSRHTLHDLEALGVEVDHGTLSPKSITTIFSTEQLAQLRAAGFTTTVLVADVQRDFVERTQAARRARGGAPVPLSVPVDPECDNMKDRRVPVNFSLGSMGGHLTYEEMLAHLDSMHSKYPTLITARTPTDTVRSIEGRPIYWVRVNGRAAVADTTQPEVLFTALHHAREPVSMHQLIYFLWYLLENYGQDSVLTALIDHTQIYAIPMINPDGYIYNQSSGSQGGGVWRKNRRLNDDSTYGVDLNRNYSVEWSNPAGSLNLPFSDLYRGKAPFSEPETRAVRNFCRQHRFKICLNYHTYGQVLIYPYGYQNRQTPDSTTYGRLGGEIVRESHYAIGTAQQTLSYKVSGGSDDYMYAAEPGKPKIYAYTPEVGLGFWPLEDEILPQIQRCQYQNIAALRAVHPLLAFDDSTGLFLRPGFNAGNAGRIRYVLRRVDPGTELASFTLTLRPIGLGHASMQAQMRTYSNISPNQNLVDSLPIATSLTGRQLQYVVEIRNGLYTSRDTLTHYDGLPQSSAAYADGCETTAGWMGTWFTDHNRPPTGRGYLSDGLGTYTSTVAFPGSEQRSLARLTPFDLRLPGLVAAELNFLTRYDIRPYYDAANVEISTDSLASWTAVCTGNMHFSSERHGQFLALNYFETLPVWDGRKPFWSRETVDLTPYLGQKVWLRFTLGMQADAAGYDGIQIDDIRIRYATATVTQAAVSMGVGLQAHPVPFQDRLSVEGASALEAYDALGRRMPCPASQTSTGLEIDTRSWPPGVYQLRSGGHAVRVLKAD